MIRLSEYVLVFLHRTVHGQNHLGAFHQIDSALHTSSLNVFMCFIFREAVAFYEKKLGRIDYLPFLITSDSWFKSVLTPAPVRRHNHHLNGTVEVTET